MDVGDKIAQRSVPKAVGHKLVEVAHGVLEENLGRAAEPWELADMAEQMVGELLGSTYVLVREGAGAESAEAWLRQALALAAAGVRMRGSDALIKIDIEIRDLPNRIGKPDPSKQVQEQQLEPCACDKDAEGKCQKCSGVLSALYKDFFGLFRKMAGFKNEIKDLCVRCRHDQLDHAMSTIVEEILSVADHVEEENKPMFGQEVLAVLHQMALMGGVRELPLTIAAWKALMEKKGIPIG